MKLKRAELNELTARVIESGLATWAGEPGGALIVRGQARLLEDITAIGDLERVRLLFDALERGESFAAPARARQHRGRRARSSSAPTIPCSPTPAARWWSPRSAIRRSAS
jgi:transcriptional regulator of heat shock response